MKSNMYTFHNKFILRTPSEPFVVSDFDEDEFMEFTKSHRFREAIYLASPVLYDEMIKWQNGELKELKQKKKLIHSLFKYRIRMQSRCTPYGLFASCSVGNWSDDTNIRVGNFTRHTRLDMNFVCSLTQQILTKDIITTQLKYFPNNSIYSVGEQLRYVEYGYINNRRFHHISSVQNNEYIKKILAFSEKGAHKSAIVELLGQNEIDEEEASDFINELIDNQILISELDPTVTGDEFINVLLSKLELLNASCNDEELQRHISILRECQKGINNLDVSLENGISDYRAILSKLKNFGVSIEENQLFQTDLYRKGLNSTISTSIQYNLIEALNFLNALMPPFPNVFLDRFKENFTKNYENKELPLLFVLDTETGIGFTGRDINGINPLIDGIPVGTGTNTSEFKWDSYQKRIFRRTLESLTSGSYILKLSDEDLENTDDYTSKSLPDTLPIMFKVLSGGKVYLQSCSGSSAINLLARFAHGDEEISDIIKEVVEFENNRSEDKILAEIVHLPESRIGNILLRPSFRDFEISYLAQSSVPLENRISLEDIYVSVRNNRIVLRSKKFDKEIIPRLSSAHNFSANSLPVYQFLCELQYQDQQKNGFGFSFGALATEYSFLPRVEYKDVILSRATWRLNEDEIIEFTRDVAGFSNKKKMPRHVCLKMGDNELIIDLQSDIHVNVLLDTLSKSKFVEIEEFLFDPNELVVKDESGNGYTNEVLAVLLANGVKDFAGHLQKANSDDHAVVQQNFHVGSEWLYFKLYCGIKTSDRILIEAVRPLVEYLIEQKLIDKFFYIRYTDPSYHLRLRFKLSDIKHIGVVMQITHNKLNQYLEYNLISRFQMDTYSRELERYGKQTIEEAESVFFYDSKAVIEFLCLIEGEQLRWQFALKSIDDLLYILGYNGQEKLRFIELHRKAFISEHGDSKQMKLAMDRRYREVKDIVEANPLYSSGSNEYSLIREILNNRKRSIKEQIEIIENKIEPATSSTNIEGLVSSFIHMTVNRIFNSRQRVFEMCIYDILYRYYKSRAARESKEIKKATNGIPTL